MISSFDNLLIIDGSGGLDALVIDALLLDKKALDKAYDDINHILMVRVIDTNTKEQAEKSTDVSIERNEPLNIS